MNGEKVTIEVDGRQLEAPRGSMLIEVMDEAGVQVPRFCYHKKLSVAANCRMCLVDVERAPKPLPACATPVTDGMKVFTRSERAQAAQRDVMAFLLINHPLDCPICDQGGECELQDNSVGFGGSRSEYAEIKRVVVDKDIGPLIETEMTRCIQCTRCVRFGEEIAGMRELGAIGRGENMEIGTYVARTVVSELSGNVIDLCPVGALTAKPSRYKARAWEMFAHDSIAPHDSVGSHIAVHTFDGKVIRVVPRSNEAVNECWISDRDRFSYQGLASPERLTAPQLRQEDGSWRAVDWETALTAVAAVLRQTDPERIGALAAPEATLEELYLFQKLMRGLGVSHIDHRLQQLDFSDQEQVSTAPTLGCSIPELEQQQAVLLIGANSRQDQPLLNHRLRKASLKGARVMAVNPYRVAYNFEVLQCAVAPADMVTELAAIAQAASEVCGQPLPDAVVALCAGLTVSEAARQMARSLCEAEKAMVLMGNLAMQHADMADLRALSSVIATLTGGTCGYLPASANSVGAWLAGVLPHRAAAGQAAAMKGRDAVAMLQEALPVYVLLHAEAEDFNNPLLAGQAFAAAEQVIAITPFAGAGLREQASILLPAGAFTET